jgi:hypothetical protein
LLAGSLGAEEAAEIEEELFGFNLLVGEHSYTSEAHDSVTVIYAPGGLATVPDGGEQGSEEVASEIWRVQRSVHQTLYDLGGRSSGPLEYALTPETDEGVFESCFGDLAVAWSLEDNIESFVTGPESPPKYNLPADTREVEGDTASDLRDLAELYWEGLEYIGVFAPCGAMAAVTEPESAPYRLVLRDVVPPEVERAAEKLP